MCAPIVYVWINFHVDGLACDCDDSQLFYTGARAEPLREANSSAKRVRARSAARLLNLLRG